MDQQNNQVLRLPSYRALTLILNEHQCQLFSGIAKQRQLTGGIVLLGRGTVKNFALNLLGLRSQKRVIITALLAADQATDMMNEIEDKLKLTRSDHGIAYMTVAEPVGAAMSAEQDEDSRTAGMEEKCMYKKLTVIVNRGQADDVVDIAREAGAKGGTVLHGRGTAGECAAKLFGIEIEPEKEVVIILLPTALVSPVTEAIYHEMQMDVPGNGILYVEPIWDVRGLTEKGQEQHE